MENSPLKYEVKIESRITTIKLSKETKARLDHIKMYKRETYEEIITKILNVLNLCRVNPERARARLVALDRQKKRNEKEMR
ncbi:MAG TPA: hypothetical protein VJK03_00805 [Candidatus Nanoarchaeia archaeon]|nr:hypothetical protein [Candidatus Nanoarchaeia archaeon]